MASSIREAESYDLIRFATAWRNLGCAITQQIEAIMDDPSPDCFAEQNPNVIDEADRKLGGMNEELDDVIAEYREWLEQSRGD